MKNQRITTFHRLWLVIAICSSLSIQSVKVCMARTLTENETRIQKNVLPICPFNGKTIYTRSMVSLTLNIEFKKRDDGTYDPELVLTTGRYGYYFFYLYGPAYCKGFEIKTNKSSYVAYGEFKFGGLPGFGGDITAAILLQGCKLSSDEGIEYIEIVGQEGNMWSWFAVLPMGTGLSNEETWRWSISANYPIIKPKYRK